MGVSVLLLSLCVGVMLLQEVVSQDSVPIVSRRQRTVIAQSDDSESDSELADPVSFSCSNVSDGVRFACGSCTSVEICNYQKQAVGSYDCSSIDPLRPYCNKGVCTKDTECTIQSDLCPAGARFYPVPSNCSEAVYCDAGLKATTYTAPSSSYMFDFETESWIFRKAPTDCFQINCAAATNLNKFFAYKPNPQLYIYCGTNGPLTFQCENANVYNESKNVCEFGCIKVGRFPVQGVKDKYYSCVEGQNGKLEKFEMACPTGTEFNEQESRCLISTSG